MNESNSNPWLIAVAVMSATFMEVLDSTVVNVSLPHIAGSLSASTEEATWVLTSYLVSNAIVLPITGWLTGYFGRKRLLTTCILIFTFSSMICGLAPSLPILIVARIFQGIGGGVLQPISQAVLLEGFPREKRGMAMSIFGMGVVVAPIIGPTLGGWITDNYSWHWIFYINLPVGIFATLMVRRFVHDSPHATKRGIDLVGFALLILWVSSLQVIFDKGQQEDWFSSGFIVTLTWVAAAALLAFVVWELLHDEPIVDLTVFGNRNFFVGTILITIIGVVLYGSTALLPLFLQTQLGYPALQSGLTVSPRGIGSIVGMILVGRIITRFDPRLIIGTGLTILGTSTFILSGISLDVTSWNITLPNIFNGFGIALIFVPLTTVAMGTLTNEQIGNATGVYNLMRNLGGGIGIATVTTYLTRNAQIYQSQLAMHTSMLNPIFQERRALLQKMLEGTLGQGGAEQGSVGILYGVLQQQANLLAYVADFRLLAILCFAALPTLLILRGVTPKKDPVAVH